MALIEIPEDINSDEAKLFLALKLFEEGKMSLGQASQYAGFSKNHSLRYWESTKYLS